MKILLIDDHVLIREALRGVIKEIRDDASILEAADCRRSMQLLEQQPDVDLILLDLTLPDGDGFTMLRELRARYRAVTIVVLSALKDRESVTRALDLGALGYIPKSAQRAVMVSALQLVFAGGIYVPPEILHDGDGPNSDALGKQATPIRKPMSSPSDLGLTGRQLDVVALMMKGKSNKAICRELEVAEATVRNHVTAILKALKVTNRTEAVIAVGELGWKLPTAKS